MTSFTRFLLPFALATTACITAGDAPPDPLAPAHPSQTNAALALGVVTGNIYADLDAHLDERLDDLAALGAKLLRVEIVGTDFTTYKRIIDAAAARGIEVLALVQSSAVGSLPLAIDLEVYAQRLEAVIDRLIAEIPNLRYVEVENEPDNYDFAPLGDGDHAEKLALLMVRVYEHVVLTRGADARPQLVGFDFSRLDEPAFRAVYNAGPIVNHRNYFRAAHGLADGLPVDIVSIHAYGERSKTPAEVGYSYRGTLRDGASFYFGQEFEQRASVRDDGEAANRSLINGLPVWITEVGYGWRELGGEARQAQAIHEGFAILREHREVQAAFYYDYRDDEGGGETDGLRGNSASGFAPHLAYAAFQDEAAR